MSQETEKLRVRVDVARCQGHARCAAIAPHVYELDDDGYNRTSEKLVDAGLREPAVRGARSCPERAITVEDLP